MMIPVVILGDGKYSITVIEERETKDPMVIFSKLESPQDVGSEVVGGSKSEATFAIKFGNVESIDVLLEKLTICREKFEESYKV